MFGHQNDITLQDQKKDATSFTQTVADDPVAQQPSAASSDDNPVVVAPAPPAGGADASLSAAPLTPTSVDGFSAPNAKLSSLSSPFAYMQTMQTMQTPAPMARPTRSAQDYDSSDGASATTDATDNTSPDPSSVAPQDSDEVQPAPVQDQGQDQTQDQDQDHAVVADVPQVPVASPPALDETSDMPPAEPVVPETTEEASQVATDTDSDTDTIAPLSSSTLDQPDLDAIRAEALQALSPLVGTLDLEPEEKFNTIMSLIHTTDNHALLNDALAVAKTIADEKERAQALFDVISEIDYFSDQTQTNQMAPQAADEYQV